MGKKKNSIEKLDEKIKEMTKDKSDDTNTPLLNRKELKERLAK